MTTQDGSRIDRGAERTGLASALRVEVQLWLAVLFMAVAFGAGVIVHAMAAPQPSPPAVVGTSGGDGVSGVFAPPLSDEQVSDGLPAGHPDIGAGSSSTPEERDDEGDRQAKDEAETDGASP